MIAELERHINGLVAEELKNAATIHPPKFTSLHEAYAVIAEERDEAWEELDMLEDWLHQAWERIKADDAKGAYIYLLNAERRAIAAAAELVQVAAMCRKARKK